jgi:hypothetical protein
MTAGELSNVDQGLITLTEMELIKMRSLGQVGVAVTVTAARPSVVQ